MEDKGIAPKVQMARLMISAPCLETKSRGVAGLGQDPHFLTSRTVEETIEDVLEVVKVTERWAARSAYNKHTDGKNR